MEVTADHERWILFHGPKMDKIASVNSKEVLKAILPQDFPLTSNRFGQWIKKGYFMFGLRMWRALRLSVGLDLSFRNLPFPF